MLLGPARVSAQETAADELAPPVATPSQVEATVTVTTTTSEVPAPPVAAVPPPPTTTYAAPAPVVYVPAPVRDPSTRPSFGTSIALHVTAAITGPLGMIGLLTGALLAILCDFGGRCDAAAALAITGGVLETASIAIGISATAVHAHTRGLVRAWELGTARLQPWGGPTGGGGALTLTF